MIHGKKLFVVIPAYNAEATLVKTCQDLPHEYVDEVILVDDCCSDATVKQAERPAITTIIHTENRGYGGNQKSCYQKAMQITTERDMVAGLLP